MSRSKQHPVLPSSYKRPSPGLGASVQPGPIHTQVASNLPFSNSGLVDYNEKGCSSFGALPPRPCTTSSKDVARHMTNESNASVDAIWAVPAPAVGAVGGVGGVGTARPKNNAMLSKSNKPSVGHSQLCTSTTAIEQVVQSYLPPSTSQHQKSRFKTSSTSPVPETPQQKNGLRADAAQNAQLQAALAKISMQVQEMNECTSRHARALQALTEKVTEAHDISLKTQSSVQDINKNMRDLKNVSATHSSQIAQHKTFAENVDSTLKKVIAANDTNHQINSTLHNLQSQKMHRRVQV